MEGWAAAIAVVAATAAANESLLEKGLEPAGAAELGGTGAFGTRGPAFAAVAAVGVERGIEQCLTLCISHSIAHTTCGAALTLVLRRLILRWAATDSGAEEYEASQR